MSIEVMSRVWKSSPASETELLLHLALADWSDDEGRLLWATTHERLANKCRTSVRNVQRLLLKMEAKGLIEFEGARSQGGRGQKAEFVVWVKLRQIGGVSETATETATSPASTPLFKRPERNTPNPRRAGADDLNPRAKGQSPRQLGTSPRQRARDEERLRHNFRMARTLGESCASTFDDDASVKLEIMHQLGGDVAEDVMAAGLNAWRARREEISA